MVTCGAEVAIQVHVVLLMGHLQHLVPGPVLGLPQGRALTPRDSRAESRCDRAGGCGKAAPDILGSVRAQLLCLDESSWAVKAVGQTEQVQGQSWGGQGSGQPAGLSARGSTW